MTAPFYEVEHSEVIIVIGANPTEVLGSRNDYTDEMFLDFSKQMINKGATILGGCCEIKPYHIKKISKLST